MSLYMILWFAWKSVLFCEPKAQHANEGIAYIAFPLEHCRKPHTHGRISALFSAEGSHSRAL